MTHQPLLRTALLLGLIAPFLLMTSCSPKKETNTESTVMNSRHSLLPEMLPRNASIGSADEQQQTMNLYQELSQKILNNSSDYKSRLQLAQLFMLEARATGEHGHYYPATLHILDGILSEKPESDIEFGAASLKASVLLSLHQFQEAKEVAEYAISLNGYNALIYGSLVDANVELGDYEEAVRMSDKMNSIRPDLRSYSRVSYLREIYGDLNGAIEAMTRAADSGYPGYEETAWCRLTLGNLYEQRGDIATAKAQYERILQERPQYPFAIAALAGIAQKEDNPQLAESLLKEAIDIIPEVSFYVDLAELYDGQGRKEETEALVDEILAMLKEDEEAGHIMNLEYANLFLNLLGDPQTALKYAEKEYAVRPENIDVNKIMAEIFVATEGVSRARHHIEVARRTDNQHPELLLLEGIIKMESFESEAGKTMIKKALSLNPYLILPEGGKYQDLNI